MKTTTRITALSFILIFAAAAARSLTIGGIESLPPANLLITHVVNVVFPSENLLCGTYVIELKNQAGLNVAPPQILTPGRSVYVFSERDDFKTCTASGVRIASLRKVQSSGPAQCSEELYAEPSVLQGNFRLGNKYHYTLFPKIQTGRE